MAQTAQEKAQQVGEKAQEMGEKVAERASRAAGYVEEKVNTGIHSVGEYLSEKNVRDMAHDVSELVKKHPIVSLAVGVGVGLLLASMLRR